MKTRVQTYPADFDGPATRTGKFLQIRLDGSPWLVFADQGVCRYHNQLLAMFLADRGIAHRWVSADSLEFDTARARIRGGGRFHLDRHARTLLLWDDSTAYGRFSGHETVRQLAAAGLPWSSLSVETA